MSQKQLFAQYKIASMILVLSWLLAACGGSSTPTATPVGGAGGEATEAATEAPTEPAGPASECANEYMPVVNGASWTLNGTGSTGDFSWVSTISEASSAGFTMTNQFTDVQTTHQWSCTPEGIAVLQYGGGPEATLTATGVTAVYETTDSSGVTFPNHIEAGDTWMQTFTVQGTLELESGLSADAEGTVTQSYTALGIESVTVPAGTFDAMKINVDLVFDLQVSIQGLLVPAEFSSSEQLWLAPGVGWVKTSASSSFNGETFDTLVELQSYSIP